MDSGLSQWSFLDNCGTFLWVCWPSVALQCWYRTWAKIWFSHCTHLFCSLTNPSHSWVPKNANVRMLVWGELRAHWASSHCFLLAAQPNPRSHTWLKQVTAAAIGGWAFPERHWPQADTETPEQRGALGVTHKGGHTMTCSRSHSGTTGF